MTTTPDLLMYFQIHRAMRASSEDLHLALAGIADDDRRRAAAIARWYRGFRVELHHHHHVEDEIFFPALAERVPTFQHIGAGLDEDHVNLAKVIDELGAALEALADDSPWARSRAEALELAAELRDHLHPHLDIEDQDVLPLFERHFSADEYRSLEQQAIKGGSVRAMLFSCPWLVASCDPATRDQIFQQVPKALEVLWKLTRRGYARRTSYALGMDVPAVRS